MSEKGFGGMQGADLAKNSENRDCLHQNFSTRVAP